MTASFSQNHANDAVEQQVTMTTTLARSSSIYYSSGDPWSEDNLRCIISLWELTAEDEALLRELGTRVRDIHHFKNDPHILLRYMNAAGGYKAAEAAFRKMIQWRRDHNIDNLLDEYKPPQTLLDYSPCAFLQGYDREGDPIYVERGGSLDGLGLIKRFSRDQLMKHATWLREVQCNGCWIHDYERRQGRKIRDITVVYDLAGLSSRHLDPRVLDWFKSYMKITSEYYPGPVKRVIVIRAPSIFRVIWNIAKHVFPAEARAKMIFTSNSNYQQVLDEYIDLSVLPPCICPQGQGEPAVGMPSLEGGRIPDHVGCGYIPSNSVFSNAETSVVSSDDGDNDDLCQVSSDISVNGGVIAMGRLVNCPQGCPQVYLTRPR